MDNPTPYRLRSDGQNSDAYYQAIAAFTNGWLANTEPALARPTAAFQAWQFGQDPERAPRTPSELAFEMLALGVLLREHGEAALQMAPAPAWLLARLVDTQDLFPLPAVEKPVKAVRGLIRGLAQGEPLSGALPDTLPFPGGAAPLVGRLVDWLFAEGLRAQGERMAEWRDFLYELTDQAAQAMLARCLLLAEDFETESAAALGSFTKDVEEFTESMEACARWRYDGGLISRQPVEYHLGMLGTEILTRAYRERFLATKRKIVIVPDCLCARTRRVAAANENSPESGGAIHGGAIHGGAVVGPTLECQAQRTDLGLRCQECTPNCKVRQITRLGEQRGFEAYILPDDFRGVGLSACRKLENTGVVGVSCALTNWDAGWQVNAAGVPAQGVLLDYAGCRSHWDDAGMVTDVNLKKLVEMAAG